MLEAQTEESTSSGGNTAVIDPDVALGRLKEGLPALRFNDLHLERAALDRAFARILGIFKEYADLLGEVPFQQNEPPPQLTNDAVEAWFDRKQLPFAAATDDTAGLWWDAIIHATTKPFLDTYAEAAIKTVDQENWRRGYCPVCGGAPDFSFLDNDKGARRLVCSRCDAEWLFQRLQCPFCDNKEADKLAYFVDSAGTYRLYVCDKCQGYIKAVDLRSSVDPRSPAVERLLTFDLDRQARDQGYIPGARTTIPS